MWTLKNSDYGDVVADQTPERGDKLCWDCVYLGNLQQYNTVLDGLYHALKEKDKRTSTTRNSTQTQEGKCVKF